MRCPVCKATVDNGPACRRCKADLSMLFAIETERGYRLAVARRAAREENWAKAQSELQETAALRIDADVCQLEAAIQLLQGDFAAAWTAYPSALKQTND